MMLCIGELEPLFLLADPQFIKSERRFKVSNNTALLVLANRNLLVSDA